MKSGDYVARITNEWQKHNKWMEFPDEKPEPYGLIVSWKWASNGINFWNVLTTSGVIECFSEKHLAVIK